MGCCVSAPARDAQAELRRRPSDKKGMLGADARSHVTPETEIVKSRAIARTLEKSAKLAAAPPTAVASLRSALGGKKVVAPNPAAADIDTAAFDAFCTYEDSVQKAALSLVGHALNKPSKRKRGKSSTLFATISMEEQTRNHQFVTIMMSGSAREPALRAYVVLATGVVDKLMARLPTMPQQLAPLASSYLSAVSRHRDIALEMVG